jgi:hypothetical protein
MSAERDAWNVPRSVANENGIIFVFFLCGLDAIPANENLSKLRMRYIALSYRLL